MATKTAPQVSAGVQPKVVRVGLVATTATYSVGSSLSNGDVIQMIKVPVNGRVMDVTLKYVSNGQGSLTVGDGIDTDRYITATTISGGATGQAVMRMNSVIAPYTYSTDDTIDVVISASAQPSSGAIYMTALIEYP